MQVEAAPLPPLSVPTLGSGPPVDISCLRCRRRLSIRSRSRGPRPICLAAMSFVVSYSEAESGISEVLSVSSSY
jgi:hypothetical protein